MPLRVYLAYKSPAGEPLGISVTLQKTVAEFAWRRRGNGEEKVCAAFEFAIIIGDSTERAASNEWKRENLRVHPERM